MDPREDSPWSRSFELVYYDASPRFRGRTHFRDADDDRLTTEQRIAYLEAYADLLRRENKLGKDWLSSEVVSDEDVAQVTGLLKDRPLPQLRRIVPLRYWRWKLQGDGNQEWAAPGYDDSFWNELEVPTVLDMGRALLLRCAAHVEPAERVMLDVEAIHDDYELWVNGQPLELHSGYEPHTVDLTAVVRAGHTNTFAIRVEQKAGYQIGIAGPIAVVGTGATFLEDVFVKPLAAVEGQPARLQVRTVVRNAGREAFLGRLGVHFYRWFPDEEATAAFEAPDVAVAVAPGETRELVQECVWAGAELWWPERPRLYRVRAVLSGAGGEAVDDAVDTVGIRTIEQRGGRLYLNGRRFVMRGYGDNLGFAPGADSHGAVCPPDSWIVKDLILARQANANTVRIHPWGFSGERGKYSDLGWPEWGLPTDGTNYVRIAEIADQVGMCLIWITRHWTLWGHGFREHYREQDLERLLVPSLKRVRNRPSIIAYEGLNEVGGSLKERVIRRRLGSQPDWVNHLLPEEIETLTHVHEQRFRDFCVRFIQLVAAVDDSRLVCPDSMWGPGYQRYPPRPNTVQQTDESVFTLSNNLYWDYHHYNGWYTDFKDVYELKERFWPDDRARAVIVGEFAAEAMPDWQRYRGLPWRNTWLNNGRPCADIERARLGRPLRVLRDSEAHLSQAYQGLCFQQMANHLRVSGCDGMNFQLLADGLSEGNYHKGLTDLYRRAKLGYYVARMVYQPTVATGIDGDFCLSEEDALHLLVINDDVRRSGQPVRVHVAVRSLDGQVVDTTEQVATLAESGSVRLRDYRPRFPGPGLYQVEYTVTPTSN